MFKIAVHDNTLPSMYYCNTLARYMLASLKAGGVGVTLTAANHAIGDNGVSAAAAAAADAVAVAVMEPWWNPTTELQAYDRLHRIGQRRQVKAYKSPPP